jgi:DNA invertase Pin-like site-specific DNA recombinase
MSTFGYARVSSDEQDLTVQREALKAAGCEMIREEKASGASREGRKELQILMDFIRPGDTLIVSKLDRLSRSTGDMLAIITELGEKGVGFKSLAEPWADTTSPAGKLMLTVMAGVAQFERERLKERQREGIERVRRNGEISEKTGRYKYAGPPQKYDPEQIRQMRASGMGPAAIARELGCSAMTVFRSLKGNGHANG